ncbi:MAG: hypothetical protein EOM40_15320 [Clostridia bacterium]|nr:hypothetical protein [Clostridia bacterium]NCC43647.1 hypothetical protein [Clostridia bacterium]
MVTMEEKTIMMENDIPLKICIDEITDAKRYCGRIYNGVRAVYLPFSGEDSLSDYIQSFWAVVNGKRDFISLFQNEDWEKFVSGLHIPWNRNFLYRKKGVLGSFYIYVLKKEEQVHFSGSLAVIEENHTLYFNTFETIEDLQQELQKVVLCFQECSSVARKERFRAIKKMSDEAIEPMIRTK